MMEKREPEKSFISLDARGEKQIHLDTFLRTLIQRCMGKALDYARMSEMSDRSLAQFERSIKDDYYLIIDDGCKLLKEFGYTTNNDK